jgi:hypothetical protein
MLEIERPHEVRNMNSEKERTTVIQKGNKRENESRQKQYDRTTLGRIKG